MHISDHDNVLYCSKKKARCMHEVSDISIINKTKYIPINGAF